VPLKSVGGGDPVLVYAKAAYGAKPTPFLLANTSTDITVYYDSDLTITAAQSSQIPPLGSVGMDGTHDVWATTLTPGTSAVLDYIPGGTAWAASPSQIALEIAESGLALNSTLENTNTEVAGTTSAVSGLPAGIAGSALPGNIGTAAVAAGLAKDTSVQAGTTAIGGLASSIPNGIASTGVPLLSAANNVINTGSTVIAAGATLTLTTVDITQTGYDVFLTIIAAAGSPVPFLSIVLTWSDSATGRAVEKDQWNMAGSSSTTILMQYGGTGPTKGDRLSVALANQDTNNSMTVNFALTQNSRIYDEDDWRTVVSNSVPSYTLPTLNPGSRILFTTGPTVAPGITAIRLLPLYAGIIVLGGTNIAGGNAALVQIVSTSDPITSAVIYSKVIAAGGVLGPDLVALPQSQCTIQITNQGGSGNISPTLTGIISPRT
jgi:hypothetical protein